MLIDTMEFIVHYNRSNKLRQMPVEFWKNSGIHDYYLEYVRNVFNVIHHTLCDNTLLVRMSNTELVHIVLNTMGTGGMFVNGICVIPSDIHLSTHSYVNKRLESKGKFNKLKTQIRVAYETKMNQVPPEEWNSFSYNNKETN